MDDGMRGWTQHLDGGFSKISVEGCHLRALNSLKIRRKC